MKLSVSELKPRMIALQDTCIKISSGGTPSRKRPDYFRTDGSGHLWIKSKELLDRSISDTEEQITDEALQNSSAKYYPANTVLMAMYGANVGQLGWLRRPATVNQAVCGMVIDEAIADFRYVFYALLEGRSKLAAQAQGAAQQNLNQDLIRRFEIPLLPLPTQRKIAAILSAYDDLIENNTRRIAILEEMAQAIYREWFVHFRFPGHEDVEMVDSELGPIPEGWEVVKLACIADVNAASIRGDESPDQINYVNISSVSTGRIEKIEPMAFEDAPSRARRIVEHGDIIWSTVRPNRKSYCLILDPVPDMIVSTGFAVITARQAPCTYLYHALTTDEFVAYLTNNATGAAYPAVNTGDFENADLLLPTGEPVQTFHNIVVDLFDEKQNLHKRNEVLRRTRDLLLPRLISGEVDVSELEINTGGLDQ